MSRELKTVKTAAVPEVVNNSIAVSAPLGFSAPLPSGAPMLTTLLQNYADLAPRLKTVKQAKDANAAKAITFLKRAMDVLVREPSDANIECFYRFIVDNYNDITSEKYALCGLNTLPPRDAVNLSVLYSTFVAYGTQPNIPAPAPHKFLRHVPAPQVHAWLVANGGK